jgi:hypothetical protein
MGRFFNAVLATALKDALTLDVGPTAGDIQEFEIATCTVASAFCNSTPPAQYRYASKKLGSYLPSHQSR